MVSPGSGSWAYTKSPRASAAYLDMPTVPRNEHIFTMGFLVTHPIVIRQLICSFVSQFAAILNYSFPCVR